MSGCTYNSGFLTLFSCGEPVAAACSVCGKPVCAKHLVAGSSGMACPDCAVHGMIGADASSQGLESPYYRQASYGDTDYAVFDSNQGGGGEVDGGGASDGWDVGDATAADAGSTSAADFQDS